MLFWRAGLLGISLLVFPIWAETNPASPAAGAPALSGSGPALPSWLSLGAELRGRVDNYFGLNGVAGWNDAWYLHRLRLNAGIRLRPWLKVVAQAQDSLAFDYDRKPVPCTVRQPFGLRQAYLDIGGPAAESWKLRVGRQPLVFGDMRLVSTSNWGNVGPAYDAVRLTGRFHGVRLDAFTALVVTSTAGVDRPRLDRKLSGVYSSLDLARKGPVLDAYVFWKSNRQAAGEDARPGDLDIYTLGLRSAGRLPRGFDYTAELALQRGHVAFDSVSAWAGHWELGRRFSPNPKLPRVALEYNYASGDSHARDGRRQSFDQLYPTNVYGTAGDFGWRNLHEPALTLEWQPNRKWKIKNCYHDFWLASRNDALYTFSGAVFASRPGALHSRVGGEFDTRFIYQMSAHFQLWTGYATLFPGAFLREAGRPAVIRYPYLMWTLSL